jgi:hypothetical protein
MSGMLGATVKFIPKEITERLENEWRQIVDPEGDTTTERPTRSTDRVRKIAAITVAHSDRNLL